MKLDSSILSSQDSQDRSSWKDLGQEAVDQFEEIRVEALEHKRAHRREELNQLGGDISVEKYMYEKLPECPNFT